MDKDQIKLFVEMMLSTSPQVHAEIFFEIKRVTADRFNKEAEDSKAMNCFVLDFIKEAGL